MQTTRFPDAHSSPPQSRNVKKVPFVELFDQRLQGVVSSGSDIERVYVSFFEAGSLNFSCSTNNNRPCGGLRGSPCGHLSELLDEAIAQYGVDRIAQYLRIPDAVADQRDIANAIRKNGSVSYAQAGSIFSRFLGHLEHLELPAESAPLTTLAWFE